MLRSDSSQPSRTREGFVYLLVCGVGLREEQPRPPLGGRLINMFFLAPQRVALIDGIYFEEFHLSNRKAPQAYDA